MTHSHARAGFLRDTERVTLDLSFVYRHRARGEQGSTVARCLRSRAEIQL